ncbi:hypothetical protein [Streptomyces griseoaurantiacus]|uniref:hypothetical protein n=1 Tax=Streptomyces griseoaurantiacus TaxID=68213 RepID=UPI0032434792
MLRALGGAVVVSGRGGHVVTGVVTDALNLADTGRYVVVVLWPAGLRKRERLALAVSPRHIRTLTRNA